MKRIKYSIILVVLIGISLMGCKKFLEIPPPQTALANTAVFSNDATANAAQLDIFYSLASKSLSYDLSAYTGSAVDEFTAYSSSGTDAMNIYQNTILANNGDTQLIWNALYTNIYQANLVLDGIASSSKISNAVKLQLEGEAKFSRAYLYFYLVNLFGDVPLVTSSNYALSAQVPRASKDQVYRQIIQDLKDAQNLLNAKYVGSDGVTPIVSQKLRPTKLAASALLARVYLYTKDWSNAEAESNTVINSGLYNLETDLNNVFLANSPEAILQSTSPPYNTVDGYYFIKGYSVLASLSPQIMNAFESGDMRKTTWVASKTSGPLTYYYPFKYKIASKSDPITENNMLLRLSEQYLIRAEAEAYGAGNGINGAVSDLNIIRNRAGLPNYSGATDQTSLLSSILHERQVELFSEEGHRFLDLKRTNSIDAVMGTPGGVSAAKGATWNSTQQLWPIPQTDIKADQNLTQNPGY